MKHLLIIAMAVTIAASTASVGQTSGKVTIPVNRTSPANGKQMFANYCAPCHGVDGRGNGPVAAALKVPPTDLTVLSKNNHGRFPDAHIANVLNQGSDLAAHGTAEMPVWGPIFNQMNHSNQQEKLVRISNLSRHLETLQVK
jgi:mono/diheme cytochrome c family protein